MCRSQRATNTEAGKRGYLQHSGQHSCCLITLAQMGLGWTSREKLTGEDGVVYYTDPKQALEGYKKLTPRKVDREIVLGPSCPLLDVSSESVTHQPANGFQW